MLRKLFWYKLIWYCLVPFVSCLSMNTSVSDSPFCCSAGDAQDVVNSVSPFYFQICIEWSDNLSRPNRNRRIKKIDVVWYKNKPSWEISALLLRRQMTDKMPKAAAFKQLQLIYEAASGDQRWVAAAEQKTNPQDITPSLTAFNEGKIKLTPFLVINLLLTLCRHVLLEQKILCQVQVCVRESGGLDCPLTKNVVKTSSNSCAFFLFSVDQWFYYDK